MYIENGYTTVVLTNHFPATYPEWRTDFEPFVRKFFRAGEIMREAAGDRLNIITGMELQLCETNHDYLVYGMTEELVMATPNLFEMPLKEFFPWADERGLLVIQAHPMRFKFGPREPWFLHGIEVYNASHNNICNKAAKLWADLYDKEYNTEGRRFIRTSGSDHHRAGQWANAGIETDFEIKDMDTLIETLKSGNYRLLCESMLESAEK